MPEEKLFVLKRVNLITEKLLVIAEERQKLNRKGINSFDGSIIEVLIQKQNNLDVLSHLAAVAWTYSNPGRIEDHIVDDLMDETWIRCIGKIEKIGGDGAIQVLENIPNEYPVDGGAAETLSDALDHLKSKKSGASSTVQSAMHKHKS